MKIAICDDEYITAEYYYEQIERIFKEYSTECEIELFTDSGKLLTSLYEGKRWDIVAAQNFCQILSKKMSKVR